MGKTVCVTGASGFIASWLVKLLLERGYTVRATVRNLGDPSKFEHLKALEGAKERLQLFQADLIVEGSFDTVIDGCDGVFHTASPVILDNVNDPQRELIEPAVKGTLNVLRSCVKASVKRVVLTSSMAAIFVQRNIKTTDVLDETWFSDPILCEEIKEWYALSKTLAEQAARKFAQENGIELLAINPGLVSGPILQSTLNRTSESFVSFVREGKNDVMPGGIFLYVDVRDVAYAHILAFEKPSANGRYCLVAKVLHGYEAFRTLCDLCPTLNFPKSSGEDRPATLPYQVSNEKAKSLGINFISLEQSLKDTVESLKERNLISFTV